MESTLEEDKRLNLQVELLKKDKSKLLSQLTAQESVIDGLRAERKLWGQELAQQGTEVENRRNVNCALVRNVHCTWYRKELVYLPCTFCVCICLGASLVQDRGRLEARIEVLLTELESQKKQNERDNDALRIKAKIVDDQTETIRKLKEVKFVYRI